MTIRRKKYDAVRQTDRYINRMTIVMKLPEPTIHLNPAAKRSNSMAHLIDVACITP